MAGFGARFAKMWQEQNEPFCEEDKKKWEEKRPTGETITSIDKTFTDHTLSNGKMCKCAIDEKWSFNSLIGTLTANIYAREISRPRPSISTK